MEDVIAFVWKRWPDVGGDVGMSQRRENPLVQRVNEELSSSISFSNPPLVEVLCGVQFSGVDWLDLHYGLFFETISNRYEYLRRSMPLSPESTTTEFVSPLQYLEFPRLWFEQKAGPYLLQLQADRLMTNWRKIDQSPYPHFKNEATEGVWSNFSKEWRNYLKFCAERNLGTPKVEYCELSYSNHFIKGQDWESIEDVLHLFSMFSMSERLPFLDRLRFDFAYGCNGIPLQISFKQAVRSSDSVEIIVMEISAQQHFDDSPNLQDWFLKANEVMVSEFSGMVTKAAKEKWGYQA